MPACLGLVLGEFEVVILTQYINNPLCDGGGGLTEDRPGAA